MTLPLRTVPGPGKSHHETRSPVRGAEARVKGADTSQVGGKRSEEGSVHPSSHPGLAPARAGGPWYRPRLWRGKESVRLLGLLPGHGPWGPNGPRCPLGFRLLGLQGLVLPDVA